MILPLGLLLWACGGSEKEKPRTFDDAVSEFTTTLSEADTTRVLSMAAEVLDSLKAGNVEWSLNAMSEVDSTGTVRPLGGETRERMERRFRNFPVMDYELDYYDFSLPGLNDLKYRTYFKSRSADADGGSAPAMALMFNPVKKGGEWYLCVKTSAQPARDASNAIDPGAIIE